MKKILVFLIFLTPTLTFAQSAFLEKVKNRTKNKVENRALNKIDKEVDKTLDEIENPSSAKTTEEKVKVNKAEHGNVASADHLTVYSKYDFVPGEKVVYAADFAQDEIGELPVNWNTSGKAELVTLDGVAGKGTQEKTREPRCSGGR